ncbi:hypothetical protein BUALT_Bualt17G0102200 [Buddleja alternifolia]|uniref:Uncharacterized protein n=1 Tax=Buddleja alternifolia TaxID=168488 RepID=A0AAV6WI56_9LAMI|nr:hypothetical protein BUALT_Bualt17G0102200 [Buddleja alternifolia]
MTVRDWRTCNMEFQPFFVLSDLWASFKEWSAYGVGVPFILNDSDSVVQYYVPYLSGIQLYTDQSKSTAKLREDETKRLNADYMGDRGVLYCLPSFVEKWLLKFDAIVASNQDYCKLNKCDWLLIFTTLPVVLNVEYFACQTFVISTYFLYLQHLPIDNHSLLRSLSKSNRQLGEESDGEYFRDSSSDSEQDRVDQLSLRERYPIYRIPTGPTLKDLDACFLTFHSLHTPMTSS